MQNARSIQVICVAQILRHEPLLTFLDSLEARVMYSLILQVQQGLANVTDWLLCFIDEVTC
jgi:hypothetical protein